MLEQALAEQAGRRGDLRIARALDALAAHGSCSVASSVLSTPRSRRSSVVVVRASRALPTSRARTGLAGLPRGLGDRGGRVAAAGRRAQLDASAASRSSAEITPSCASSGR